MKTMKLAIMVAAMTMAMGWWVGEARGDGTSQKVEMGPVPRFTVQADTNCVVDNLTGLMWARNANLPGATQTWAQAVVFCKNLNYGGHSDWRLPNMMEFYSLMNTNYSKPRLSNTEGTAQWKEKDPFTGLQIYGVYWMTTTTTGQPAGAWLANIEGNISRENNIETTGAGYVWPVREVKERQP